MEANIKQIFWKVRVRPLDNSKHSSNDAIQKTEKIPYQETNHQDFHRTKRVPKSCTLNLLQAKISLKSRFRTAIL